MFVTTPDELLAKLLAENGMEGLRDFEIPEADFAERLAELQGQVPHRELEPEHLAALAITRAAWRLYGVPKRENGAVEARQEDAKARLVEQAAQTLRGIDTRHFPSLVEAQQEIKVALEANANGLETVASTVSGEGALARQMLDEFISTLATTSADETQQVVGAIEALKPLAKRALWLLGGILFVLLFLAGRSFAQVDAVRVQDEGTTQKQWAGGIASINFTGGGIACSYNAGQNRVNCTVSGGAGSTVFTDITSGTNTTAAMVVGSGASLRTTAGILGIPNGTTPPVTCTVGDTFLDTDAAAGSRHLLCTATDTWTGMDNPFGSAIGDAEVDDNITLTNITQITNRSHTSLSDIGTNTHAQIDTHIAAANPHSGSAASSVTLTAGAGLSGGGDLTTNRSFATASGEADFLASGALTCGAGTQGKLQVHTTPLQYCDNAGTPALQYAAYGNSTGEATSVATGAVADGDLANNYSGTGSCTNQFVRGVNDNAAPTCATVAAADVAADVATQAEIDAKANTSTTVSAGTGLTGGGDLSTNRTLSFDYSDVGADPAFNAGECRFSNEGANAAGWVCEGETANTIETRFRVTDPTSADRIVTIPDADSTTVQPDTGASNNFLTAISASGVISKAQPAFSNISGSTDPDQIGGGTAADDKVLIADSASAATWRAIPNCTNNTTEKLNYDAATNVWECNTDQTGAGGGDAITVDGAGNPVTDPDFIDTATINVAADTVASPDTIAWNVIANSIGPTQVDETVSYAWTAPHTLTTTSGDAFTITTSTTGTTSRWAQYNSATGSNTTANIGSVVGGGFDAYHNAAGTFTSLKGMEAFASAASGSGGGTTVVGFIGSADNSSANTVSELLGVRINSNTRTGAGAVTTNIGLSIQNQAVAGATNYSIKTGTGLVDFGDVVNSATGFRIAGAAATNNVLVGNGTNFVSTATSGTGAPVGTGRTLTGGAGIAALGDLSADRTIATASGEADFLASGALTCGASTQGKMQVHTTPLQYCDNAATPALQYAAYGNSTGESTAAANNSVALGTDTTNDYVSTLATGLGLSGSGTGETSTPTVSIDYAQTLGGNPALNLGEVIFSDDCTGGGFISEGTTANTNEQRYCFPAVDGADTINFLVTDNTETTSVDGSGLAITSGTLDVAVGVGVAITSDAVALKYTDTQAGNPALNAEEVVFTTDGSGGGILFEGTTADTNEGLVQWNPTTDKVLTLPDATDTLVGKATTDVLTNKTIDAEDTGNVITIVSEIEFHAATCIAATATLNADDTPNLTEPAAACETHGSSPNGITHAVAAFDQTTDEGFLFSYDLPSTWASAESTEITFIWHSGTTTNSVVWGVRTSCRADAEVFNATWNTASTVTDAAKGTANQRNEATITGITMTGCAAGEELFLEIFRDADNGSDNHAADALLTKVKLKVRLAQ
jgi:hypothetical protein